MKASRNRAPESGSQRSDEPFALALQRVLRKEDVSLREAAARAGVSASHLSRVVNGASGKRVTADLTRDIAVGLGLKPDYFREFRHAVVVEHLASNVAAADALYDQLGRQRVAKIAQRLKDQRRAGQ